MCLRSLHLPISFVQKNSQTCLYQTNCIDYSASAAAAAAAAAVMMKRIQMQVLLQSIWALATSSMANG